MKPILPAIIITASDSDVEGIAAFSMKSILKQDLMNNQLAVGKNGNVKLLFGEPAYHQRCREEFLHAISTWPQNVTCEIQFLSLPNLASRLKGKLWITFVIRIKGVSEQIVKADVFRRFIEISPLLSVFFPEAEFEPITESEELKFRIFACQFNHALMVRRRRESIVTDSPIRRHSMGFGPIKEIHYNAAVDTDANLFCFPWQPSMDDWSNLLQILFGQMDPIQIIIRIQRAENCEPEKARLEEAIQFCQKNYFTDSSPKSFQADYSRMIQDCLLQQLTAISNSAFHTGVYILSECQIDISVGNVLGKSITRVVEILDQNVPFVGGFACRIVPVSEAMGIDWLNHAETLSIGETACAFRLPGPPTTDLSFLPVRRHRAVPAILPKKYNPRKTDISLFINDYQGMEQPIQMNTEDRMRHMFIVGQTGTGKSTLMESMILQDIQTGKGLAVVDPHGDMVDNILGKIPRKRMKDVIVFDLLEKENPPGLNLLEWETIEERDIVIDDLYQNLDRMYDFSVTGGPVFEHYFRGMLCLLLGDKPRPGFIPTLLDFIHCFESKDFRNWLDSTIDDPVVKKFLTEIEVADGDVRINKVAPYITSKFSRFANDTRLKRIIGQSRSSLNFQNIMNDGKVLLMKLGRGRFGQTVSALIANQIVSRFKLAAMKRGDMPVASRREFYLYVDECQTLPPENFMELLSEARKYRMGIILATQYTAQLSQRTGGMNSLLSAIIGNVGSMLIFRLGQMDAELMEQVLKPALNKQDITGLPNFQGYARIQLCNETLLPFSFRTVMDDIPYDSNKAKKIQKYSSETYGMNCRDIDKEILDRLQNYEKMVEKPVRMSHINLMPKGYASDGKSQ